MATKKFKAVITITHEWEGDTEDYPEGYSDAQMCECDQQNLEDDPVSLLGLDSIKSDLNVKVEVVKDGS